MVRGGPPWSSKAGFLQNRPMAHPSSQSNPPSTISRHELLDEAVACPGLPGGPRGVYRLSYTSISKHSGKVFEDACGSARAEGTVFAPSFSGSLVNRARATLHERLGCRMQAVARTTLCLLQAYYGHRWCLCRGLLAGSGAAKVDAPKKSVNEIQERYWG
jgi:hypothetical protein